MNAKTCSALIIISVLSFYAMTAVGQVHVGGLADFEIRKGGSDSSPYVNQTPNKNWSVYTPYLRLFLGGNISDKWFVSAALQADYYDGKQLSPVFFSVMNINYLPITNSDFTITAGRFVTPYGAYSNRVLSSDNSFVHLPLSHASGLPISKTRGTLYSQVDYGEDITGLTMVYQRMYTQGIMVGNRLGDTGWLRYNLAATLAAASSHFEYGEHASPAFTGRIVLQPVIWGSLGLSLSHGSYMKRDDVNISLSDDELAGYKQTLFGSDIELSYHYFTFLASYNWSKWEAPYLDSVGTSISRLWEDEVQVHHISSELVMDFPFLPGAYAGIRAERLISGDLKNNQSTYNYEQWTYDRDRIEFTTGFKLERNVVLKASYLYSTNSGTELNDNVFALQLSAGF
ncbi:hypothetical protein [Gracilimonas sp.]|uniref:hypothetical protein n=1 Tax=Gracilimonas sp. TaxID=1974203 RepID=UPI003BAABA54